MGGDGAASAASAPAAVPPHGSTSASAADSPPSSITSHGEGGAGAPAETRSGATVKRRVALSIGYVGTRYSGSQFQKNMPTIDGVLEDAIYKAGGIAERNHGELSKVGWSRSSRTDKGVHAVGAVVSLKMELDPQLVAPPVDASPESANRVQPLRRSDARALVAAIGTHLPDDVRVFDMHRVRSSFLARQACNYRRYEYLLPAALLTWSWTPPAAPVPATDAIAALSLSPAADPPADPTSGRAVPHAGGVAAAPGAEGPGRGGTGAGQMWPARVVLDVFREDPERPAEVAVEGFRRILRQFVGTHHMHNFTVRSTRRKKQKAKDLRASGTWRKDRRAVRPASDDDGDEEKASGENVSDRRGPHRAPAEAEEQEEGGEVESEGGGLAGEGREGDIGRDDIADVEFREGLDPYLMRTVYEFDCSDVIEVAGRRFVVLTVAGQSFVLHQIRMMIGMAVAVWQGYIPEHMVHVSLDSPFKVEVPIAPGGNLLLDSCAFAPEEREQVGGGYDALRMSEEGRAAADAFKREVVYPHIAEQCVRAPHLEQFLKFLHTVHISPHRALFLDSAFRTWRNLVQERQSVRQAEMAAERDGAGGDDKQRPQRMLPSGLVTALCVRFGITPGQVTMDVRAGLEDAARRGELPINGPVDEYVAYVSQHGLAECADAGRRIRTRRPHLTISSASVPGDAGIAPCAGVANTGTKPPDVPVSTNT